MNAIFIILHLTLYNLHSQFKTEIIDFLYFIKYYIIIISIEIEL